MVTARSHAHSGPCIVAGNAWCLHDDLARAGERWPDAPVIAVNGAAGEVRAFALFTQHPRKFPKWIAWQRARFGDGFSTHAAGKAHMRTKIGDVPDMPWVDHWWDNVASGGTSGWGARRMAGLMGFRPVILCGMPLAPGGYASGRLKSKQLGHMSEALKGYRAAIMKDTGWHDGTVSMSGWTAEQFGG